MKTILLLLCCFLTAQLSIAQTADALYKKADSLYKAKDFKNAAIAYTAGIKMEGKDAEFAWHWYAASSWSLANVADSAFQMLNIIAASNKISPGDANSIETASDFTALHTDKRWGPLMDKIMAVPRPIIRWRN